MTYPKFIKELYTEDEIRLVNKLMDGYWESSNELEKHALKAQLKKIIQLECKRCAISGSLYEFCDIYGEVRDICFDCYKDEYDLDNFLYYFYENLGN